MQDDFRVGEWRVQPLRDVMESTGQSVRLEPKAMDLLVYLAQFPGEVLPKKRLIQSVWPDAFVTDEVLTNNIWRLRQAFGDDPKDPTYIETVHRRGYRLIAEVILLAEAAEEEPRYRIQEKLGQGAMGKVYLAEDKHLHRRVALKFLLEEMEQDDHWHRRLIREARAAAALDHPFICKVYDTGRIEGRTFIAMEYVRGDTLKERLARGALPEEEAIQIARETAEALETAHQEGLVHRDIKPSNIILTQQGHVKLTDFGVAKRIRAAEGQEQEWTATLTKEASTLGTLPYMSPEQIRGQPLDARSDLFSLGVVLYEMLTGAHPFRKGLSADTAAAILTGETLPLSHFEEGVSESLERVLTTALAKNPESRFQSMAELRAALTSDYHQPVPSADTAKPASRPRNRAFMGFAAVAITALLILGGWFLVTEKWSPPNPEEFPSIAVLPLDNLRQDTDQDYLVDGSTEGLIMELGKVSGLRVISRQSVMQYKGSKKMLPVIAREFEAAGGYPLDAVLNGSVVLDEEKVRVRVTLTQVQPEAILWTHAYEQELGRLPELYGEVAREIASRLKGSLTDEEEKLLSAAQPVDPQVYQAYLKGNYLLQDGSGKGKPGRRLEYFQEALDLDPTFAPAYAGLASVYSELDEQYPSESYCPKAKEAALRALDLDDSLAVAHGTLAYVSFKCDWEWVQADEQFKRAIELDPTEARTRMTYSRYLTCMGRFDEAIAEGKRAIQMDPLSGLNELQLVWTLVMSRRYDEAISQCEKILDLHPDRSFARLHLSWPYALKGDYSRAVAELDRIGFDSLQTSVSAAWIYGMAGQIEKTETILKNLLAVDADPNEYLDPYFLVLPLLILGHRDRALDQLERAYEQRSTYMAHLKTEPLLDPIRDEPRFKELLRKVNLAEAGPNGL